MSKIKIGDTVQFTGYVGEMDKELQSKDIKKGESYEVSNIADEDTDDPCYEVIVKNPSKRKGAKPLSAELYADECELVTAPIKDTRRSAKKSAAKKEPEPEVQEDKAEAKGGAEDFVEPDDAEVGEDYDVQMKDEGIPIFTGTCTRVTKTLIYIDDDKHKKADIDVLFYADGTDTGTDEGGVEGEDPVADKAEEQQKGDDDKKQDKEPAKSEKKATTRKGRTSTKKKAASKKKTPAKQAKQETPDEPEVGGSVNNEDAEILALVEDTKDANDLCDLAVECLEDTALMEWRLGGVLHHVLEDKAYEVLSDAYTGRGGFERYCVNDLGVKYRKARYLINIYVEFSNAGLNGADLARIGWTKARNLLKVINEDNAQEMLQLAEDNTVESLIDEIKIMEEKLNPDHAPAETGDTVKKMSMKFQYFENDASFIAQSLSQVMEADGLEKESEALYAIVTKYMTELFE